MLIVAVGRQSMRPHPRAPSWWRQAHRRPVRSMRRIFIGGTHAAASKPAISAASVDRQPAVSNAAHRRDAAAALEQRVAEAACSTCRTRRRCRCRDTRDRSTHAAYVTIAVMTLPSRGARAARERHRRSDLSVVGRAPRRSRGTSAGPSAPRHDSFDELYLRGPARQRRDQDADRALHRDHDLLAADADHSCRTARSRSSGRRAWCCATPTRTCAWSSSTGNKMTMSWPSHNVRQTTDIGTAQGRVQKYFVNGTAADLRWQFDIEEHDASDRPGTLSS